MSGTSINFIDIGASVSFPEQYRKIEHIVNLFAFDLNVEECARLALQPNGFLSAQYLPYAIAGKTAEYTLYKTGSIYTSSLLKPDMKRFGRFLCGESFAVRETEQVQGRALSDVHELKGVNVDAIKVDAQGLDLECLKGGEQFVNDAFLIDAEPAFHRNYENECTFGELEKYLTDRGFLLFDMQPRSLERAALNGKREVVYCETIWLKDYIALYEERAFSMTKEKALKALVLCDCIEAFDYGAELLAFFNDHGITDGVLA